MRLLNSIHSISVGFLVTHLLLLLLFVSLYSNIVASAERDAVVNPIRLRHCHLYFFSLFPYSLCLLSLSLFQPFKKTTSLLNKTHKRASLKARFTLEVLNAFLLKKMGSGNPCHFPKIIGILSTPPPRYLFFWFFVLLFFLMTRWPIFHTHLTDPNSQTTMKFSSFFLFDVDEEKNKNNKKKIEMEKYQSYSVWWDARPRSVGLNVFSARCVVVCLLISGCGAAVV